MTDQTPHASITEPGIYEMPLDDYRADPVAGGSLSSSGARNLLPPSCPALFRYNQLNPEESKDHFDFGSAAHKTLLNDGPEIVIVDAADWKRPVNQELRKQIRAEGKVPLLPKNMEQIDAMAQAVREHPEAGALFSGGGKAEPTLVWQDEYTGVWCRSRLDFWPDWVTEDDGIIIPEYKTTHSAAPSALPSIILDCGYHVQGAWEREAVLATNPYGATNVTIYFVFQEKTPPYLITVKKLRDDALRIGMADAHKAREIYRDCVEQDVWPGYDNDDETVSLPGWYLNQRALDV